MPIRLGLETKVFASIGLLDLGVWITAAFLLLFSVKDRFFFGHNRLAAYLYIPAAVSLLSFIWTKNNISTFKYTYYSLTSALAFWVTVNIFRDASPKKILGYMALFIGVSLSIASLYWSRISWVWDFFRFTNLSVDTWDEFDRAAAFARLDHPYIGRSNDFASVLAMFTMIFFGMSVVTRKSYYTVVSLLSLLGVALTLSRGVYLAVGIVFVCAVLLNRPSKITLAAFGGVAVIAAVTALYVNSVEDTGIDILSDRINQRQNIDNRLERYDVAVSLIKASPLFGVGAGHYLGAAFDSVDSAVHNTYLEQIVSFGVPLGLLLISTLLVIPFILWNWNTTDAGIKSVARYGAAGAIIFLIVCFTQTANEAAIPRMFFHIYLGLIVALLRRLEYCMAPFKDSN